jgi:hypothetical protein
MKRYNRIGALCVLVIVGVALVVGPSGLAHPAAAQGPDKVGLVVRLGNGSIFTDCIDYTGPGMTGEDVLDQSGLSLVKEIYPGLGAAICKIQDDGCEYPQANCFCQCSGGGECRYWAYFHLDQQAGAWVYSGMGASWHTVQPGDVEGWAWGAGTPEQSQTEPPLFTFEDLCSPPTPTPTNTPEASPPVVDFSAEPEHIVWGECSTLSWSVDNGEIVALDGEGVRADDTRYVCPQGTRTYELQVLNGAGEYFYEVTIKVAQPTATPPSTATPTTRRSDTPRPTSTSRATPTTRAQQPVVSPSPSPTLPPVATPTSMPTVVALAHTPTPTTIGETSPDESETHHPVAAEPTDTVAPPETEPQEAVGLDRILLLLGVGAGTLGFGALAFVGTVVLLVVIYLRARAQF